MNGTFKDNDISLDLSIVGGDVVCVSNKKNTLAKFSLPKLKGLFEKNLNKELSDSEFSKLIENCGASLDVEADFDIELSEPYSYGEDRDGNRGETRQDFEPVEDSDVYISKALLTFFDDNGTEIGEAIDISSEHEDSIRSFVAEIIDSDPNRYVN